MIFTIAIPTYNNENTIQKAIDSALNQDYKDEYQILVVNNNSNDETEKVLNGFGDIITVIKNKTTVTLFENHNVCLKNAKGDYTIFCHSDDVLLPDALTKLYLILKNRGFPSRYVLWGRSMFRDFQTNWENGGGKLNQILSGINSIKAFQLGGLTPSGTCYTTKSVLDAGGFPKTNLKLTPSDLTIMWKLTLESFEFEMVDRIFFIRTFASTGDLTDSNKIYESLLDSIHEIKIELGKQKFEMVVSKLLEFNQIINPILIRIIKEKRIIPEKILKRKILVYMIKNPKHILNMKYMSLLA